LFCSCSSWFALRYCSAFSLSLDFDIVFLVGRVFGQVKVSALVVRELRGAFFDLCWESCGPIAFDPFRLL